MKASEEQALEQQLRSEGFARVYVWQDGANVLYPEHTHPTETAHVVLDGQMTVIMNGGAHTYRSGDRLDVPAGSEHCAQIGPKGCRYLIGER